MQTTDTTIESAKQKRGVLGPMQKKTDFVPFFCCSFLFFSPFHEIYGKWELILCKLLQLKEAKLKYWLCFAMTMAMNRI